MSDETPVKETRLEAIERKRAERKAALTAGHDEQRASDLEAIDLLEQEHGDHNVATLNVDCSPGLPTMIACRAANPSELKRYRAMCKPGKHGGEPRYAEAGEQLGDAARIYPDAATFAKILAERPGALLQLGVAAVELATAKEADHSKS